MTRQLQAELAEVKRTWEMLGAHDPMWAALTRPEARGGRWDSVAFLASGEDILLWIEQRMAALDLVPQRNHALDFGCGPGRLTAALARAYVSACGFDIAGSMVRAARKLVITRHAVFTAQAWDTPSLPCYRSGEFDFVLTILTLQHMGPPLAVAYIQELARVTAPGGVLVLQAPDARVDHMPRAASPGDEALPPMPMTEIPQEAIVAALEIGGARMAATISSLSSCPGWHDRWYFARKE